MVGSGRCLTTGESIVLIAKLRAQKDVPTEEGQKEIAFLKKRGEQMSFQLRVMNAKRAVLEYKLKIYDQAEKR